MGLSYRDILKRFKENVRGTKAVIFCDHEGETIEFISDFDSYHTQLFGAYQAELFVVLQRAAESARAGLLNSMQIKVEDGAISLWPIGEQYYLAIMSRATLCQDHPAVRELMRALESEI